MSDDMEDLFDRLPPEKTFDGLTYDSSRDYARLKTQLQRVRHFMSDGQWHSLSEIAEAVGGSEAGASARIRDLRKLKFGSHTVDKFCKDGGYWLYKLRPSIETA